MVATCPANIAGEFGVAAIAGRALYAKKPMGTASNAETIRGFMIFLRGGGWTVDPGGTRGSTATWPNVTRSLHPLNIGRCPSIVQVQTPSAARCNAREEGGHTRDGRR